jgi:predicted metalloprotease with PDZ domain
MNTNKNAFVRFLYFFIGFFLYLASLPAAGQTTPTRISVDATDSTRRLYHIKMTMPVKPGPLTLLYPEWIPGEHGPTGPITDLVNVKITGNGASIPWRRDLAEMYSFQVTVPPGVNSIDITMEYVATPDSGGFSSGASTTSKLAVLSWNQVLLYPKGTPSDQLNYQAELKVPAGWSYGTALPIETESGQNIQFKPSSLTTLIDSPVLMGSFFKTFDLSPGSTPPHYLHIAADSEHATDASEDEITHLRNLVRETGVLFGARHYRSYHFLLTLSDHVAHFGLEHHESSDDRTLERTLIDDSLRRADASLLTHEMTHSWNGKYRRPAGLATPDYSEPMKGNLLWVYEGLTNYLGEILAPRSGLLTAVEFRQDLAREAAMLDNRTGRAWRTLQDTADAAQLLYDARKDYTDLRRSVDYYEEGTLIWLEADVTIRRLSQGAKSLDDFVKAFTGPPSSGPMVKPYTFEDVVQTLNAVQPYDWAGFLRERLESTSPHAPLGGIENSGWKLVYTEQASDMFRNHEAYDRVFDLSYSIGLRAKEDGMIEDVRMGGPAQKAGVAPATKIIAVNGRRFNPQLLHDAVAAKSAAPLEIMVEDGEFFKTFRIDYHGGEKYPHLVRDESKPDLLTAITAPHAGGSN